ncbi:MAG: endonuclease [Acholeplasmataceae bacterium]|nr:endonuclease [Acholeplasmataceae bacterium]
MAKRKSKTSKEKSLIYIIMVVIFLFAYYAYGLIDTTENATYSIDQDANGYYYYTYVSSTDYYDGTNDLIGNSLKSELHTIINQDLERTSYDEARELLAISDLSLTDRTKVYNIYDSELVPSLWDGGASWNREHVWPNSRLGLDRVSGSNRTIASDLHNLRAATPSVNSSRSDRFYSDGSGDYTTTDDGGFYPGDDHKGDVARIILYMAVMYDDLILTDDLDALLDESAHYTPAGAKMGQLNLLLRWHKQDPVDEFEQQRNQAIFEAQGNRNPFIDKPEFVHLIWENKAINDLLNSDEAVHFENGFIALMIKENDYATYIN